MSIEDVLKKRHLKHHLSAETDVYIGFDEAEVPVLYVRHQNEWLVTRRLDDWTDQPAANPHDKLPLPELRSKDDIQFFFTKEDIPNYFRQDDFEIINDTQTPAPPQPVLKPELTPNTDSAPQPLKHLGRPKSPSPKQLISLRIEPHHIQKAKQVADKMGIGYQTLFRMWIVEQLNKS